MFIFNSAYNILTSTEFHLGSVSACKARFRASLPRANPNLGEAVKSLRPSEEGSYPGGTYRKSSNYAW